MREPCRMDSGSGGRRGVRADLRALSDGRAAVEVIPVSVRCLDVWPRSVVEGIRIGAGHGSKAGG